MSLFFRALLLLCLALTLGACASMRSAPGSPGQKLDPWEPWNRKVFAFNESLDANILKPVATVYSNIVPGPIRQSVDNFFNNVGDAWTAVNLVLQGRFKASVEQGMRFAVNSTLGFGGLIDIGTEVGLERKNEDMGKTFGRWGTGTGAYIVWPLFGPSSVRDTLAMPFDWQASPSFIFRDGASKVGIYSLQTINARSNFLRASEMLEGIALDKYTFYRDAFLQRRGNLGDDDEFEVLVPTVKEESNPQAGP
ncbi:MlaA family lipoprotein [Roseateles oligotrophus]|uniref:VacJ family lipoprotein n=1 Tax=Roseateles oligotrophus TaxID=1769250 RepID=A0ABT2YEQ2_9BURK|nr:VacJ family lipoprotein [Roseateles oligotrophus]MCV2368503.1 VacJ family lipoprotein [Roseateles oligotrophus]